MDKLPVDRATCERLSLGTDEVTVFAGGELFAIELRMKPGGGPPLMHRHRPAEIYHVLEGEFTFYLGNGDSRIAAVAGDVVPLAGGTPHTVRNESDADAVAFVVHAPGAPMENFTREVAAMAPGDMAAALAIAERHGIEMLGPVHQ